jgi:hypothetical protein
MLYTFCRAKLLILHKLYGIVAPGTTFEDLAEVIAELNDPTDSDS